MLSTGGALRREADEYPTHAGLVLKAGDTGRILMIQRSIPGPDDDDDPNGGLWEFPGGGLDRGDHSTLDGAMREFAEEVGRPVPRAGVLSHTWRSSDGVYQGHVLVVPSEDALELRHGRTVDNPDGDRHEPAAWWEPDHAAKNPALRPEVKGSPWKAIKMAAQQDEQAWQVAEDALELALTRGVDPGMVATDLIQSATPPPGDNQDPGLAPQDGQVPDDEMGDMPPEATQGDPSAPPAPGGTPGMGQDPTMAQGAPQGVPPGVDQDPEHALPTTYGQEPEPPMPPRAKASSLTKRSLRDFSPTEQRMIIEEGGLLGAGNRDRLDLAGTHYLPDDEDDDLYG